MNSWDLPSGSKPELPTPCSIGSTSSGAALVRLSFRPLQQVHDIADLPEPIRNAGCRKRRPRRLVNRSKVVSAGGLGDRGDAIVQLIRQALVNRMNRRVVRFGRSTEMWSLPSRLPYDLEAMWLRSFRPALVVCPGCPLRVGRIYYLRLRYTVAARGAWPTIRTSGLGSFSVHVAALALGTPVAVLQSGCDTDTSWRICAATAAGKSMSRPNRREWGRRSSTKQRRR